MAPSAGGDFDVRRIAVIGAGPCGLATAKYLLAQGTFDKVDVYEQEDEVGGVWYYSKEPPAAPCPVPQADPFLPPDKPLVRGGGGAGPLFPSPMYEKLHANIPGTLMKFSDQDFPEGGWVFPRRETIQEYLVRYAEEVRDSIRFSFRVSDVALEKSADGVHDRWRLEARSTVSDEVVRGTYDAVVVANGHYSTPFIPDIKGIADFDEAHPSVVMHSKAYRSGESFRGKKVIVVGNGPSGTDIAAQISPFSRQPALLSVKEPTPAERLEHTGCREVAEIVEFLPGDGRSVRLSDGSVETGVDRIVFCTGFLYSFPFLPDDIQRRLITDGRGVHGLYRHLVSVDHPTLAFPCLNIMAIPWPLAEVQAAVYAGLWSNQLRLPGRDVMEAWSRKLTEERSPRIHVFKSPEDGHYHNELHDWAVQATHLGKVPPRWGDFEFWQRSLFPIAKLRFEQQGCTATTLDELGLHYEPAEAGEAKAAAEKAAVEKTAADTASADIATSS
ncbi:putative flavoprotein CzcO associated with the cation diffusion facilitator CzcD [Geosmithia morbida]|uniref:Flavoprotein CzcO associated with the cation diffusion facilitator CzcD n=1 Tax=Geosmithia morbida TaxID=1094350 RepID=A0A9P4YMH3_9HYPO|nr:putative flavoprotein CzcO associated with the cation diffusion facilitator CzcD [Geosmithia morbida]KAF4119693.1 putative flavoprotein CzcO associated with the cation diffusion facilitator CzcD [Geosmithia morbida]